MNRRLLRIVGWPENANALHFIQIVREFGAVDLPTAKGWLDRLKSGESVEIEVADVPAARDAGGSLLMQHLVERAELVASGGQTGESIAPPPPPTVLACPHCQGKLVAGCEYRICGWLRFPGDRTGWGKHGPCPQCGFSYRWDGTRCSHCGSGTVEQPPLMLVVEARK